MKILMTADSASLANGISRHILSIAPELNVKYGVEVRVLTLEARGDLHKELDKYSIQSYALGEKNGRKLSVLFGFCRVMREFIPDIVHGHQLAIMERFAMTWFFRNTKLVTTEHGYGTPAPTLKGIRKAYMALRHFVLWRFLLYRRSDLIIAVSGGVKHDFKADVVIYNPIKLPNHGNSKKDTEHIIIGTACRISAIKNPVLFCRVIKDVVARCSDAEAWIIGLPDNSDIDSAVKSTIGNSPRIRLLGYRTDSPELIAKMSCFIMTSSREGMPTALLEAIACKTPIAFMEGGGGLTDLTELNKKNGPFAIVSPPGDINDMTTKILELLRNRMLAKEYANKAFNIAKKYFSIEICVSKLLREYERLLELPTPK